MASKSAGGNAQNSVKRKAKPRGKPFAAGNVHAFKSREENGGQVDPRINAGGRPKLLGESYKAMLARVNETDPQKRTNAELIANAALVAALGGDVGAMREIRSATEGEQLKHSGELNVSGGFAVKPIDYAVAIAALAPGPVADSEPSGTD